MPYLNKWTGIGVAGRDGEIKTTATGKQVLNFSVAISRGFGDKRTTTWVNVTVWKGNYDLPVIKKGDHVIVEGEIQTNEYSDNSGAKRVMTFINAHKVTPFQVVKKEYHERPNQGGPPASSGEGDPTFPF
jgi:single stranded DNA-binding protein